MPKHPEKKKSLGERVIGQQRQVLQNPDIRRKLGLPPLPAKPKKKAAARLKTGNKSE